MKIRGFLWSLCGIKVHTHMDCFWGGFAFTFSVKYLKIYHFFWYWFYFLNTIVALWKYFLEFHHILLVLRTCSAVCMSVFLLLFSIMPPFFL